MWSGDVLTLDVCVVDTGIVDSRCVNDRVENRGARDREVSCSESLEDGTRGVGRVLVELRWS